MTPRDFLRVASDRDQGGDGGAGGKPPRFPLVPFDQIRLSTAPRYRVRGLLPMKGLAVIWGPWKSGKSFVVCDLLLHVALGWEWQGRTVQPGAVIYCCLEGAHGFEARAVAFQQERMSGHDGAVPFYLMPASLALTAEAGDFIAAVRAQLGPDVSPAVICLDTLNRSFTGSESDDKEMTAYVRAADKIRDAFDCLVLIVHHSGHDATRPRGHTALMGAVDAQLSVKKAGEGFVSLHVDLMKDGPAGEELSLRLEGVEVGTAETGEAITSCVVRSADGADVPKPEPQRRPLKPEHRLALDALSEAVIGFGEPAPAGYGAPPNTRAVHLDAWRDELFRRGILDRSHSNPSVVYKRIRQALAAAGYVAERDERVWPAKAPG